MTADFRTPDRELKGKLQASREYWRSEGRAGAPLVLPGADLRRTDLREQVFVEAQLQGADLRGALLDSALLMRAALDGARVNGASLFSANASKASLIEAQLAGLQAPRSIWRSAILIRADFTGALLDDADLMGAELIGANLSRASLVRADLSDTSMLEARLRDADLTDARVDGAAAEPRTFAGTRGTFLGEPIVGAERITRRRSDDEREFEAAVRERLRSGRLEAMWGFNPGPDFVARLSHRWFASIEVSTSDDRRRLFRLADRADLIVVPDRLDVRRAVNDTPVAHLREVTGMVLNLDRTQLKPFGAEAVAMRQGARLRPYVAFADYVSTDRTALSRITGWLDSRERAQLRGPDKIIVDHLPAHLGGDMAARSLDWIAEHSASVERLLAEGAQIRQGRSLGLDRATDIANEGLALEQELARSISLKVYE